VLLNKEADTNLPNRLSLNPIKVSTLKMLGFFTG